jgi:hypothetical protein
LVAVVVVVVGVAVVVGVVVVGVDVGVMVVVVVVVGVLVVSVVVGLAADVELQSCWASWLTVPAPWPRFCTSVLLTVCGSWAISLLSAAAALCARAQSWAEIAEETAFKLLARRLLWSDESSPVLLPHATTKATVNPRPPARIARLPKPIRRLTLARIGLAGVERRFRICSGYWP